MTSPASTSRETRSTASRGPYHLVSWWATMTGGIGRGASQHRRAAGPALDDDAAVAEYVQVALELLHLELVGEGLAEVIAEAGDVSRDVRTGRARLGPGGVLHLVLLHEERRLRELADVPAVVEVHVADRDVHDVVRRQA